MQILLKLARRNEKPVFVNNKQEFLSLWSVAHAWENLSPGAINAIDIPESIQANIDSLLLSFMREEIPLRTSYGYRVLGHTFLHAILGLDTDYERIADQLYRKTSLDKSFLDGLYIKRSDFLRWCENEYREPPACWAPQPTKAGDKQLAEDIDEAEEEGWFDQLTERRRRIVACLEVAKHLWQKDPKLSYEDVYNDPLLAQTGLRMFFTPESFKKWARRVASDDAKRGGRRPQSAA